MGTTLGQALEVLKDGPKFPAQLGPRRPFQRCAHWFEAGYLCRSKSRHAFAHPSGRKWGYAYGRPELAGKTVAWTYNGQEYSDSFEMYGGQQKREPPAKPENPLQKAIIAVLSEHGALFSEEICEHVNKVRKTKLKGTRLALRKLLKKGVVIRFDERRGGWKYEKGHLYALAESSDAFSKRLESLDDKVLRPTERALLNHVRGAVWLAKDLRQEIAVEDNLLTWILRKLGKEGPYSAKAEGSGNQYRIEIVKNESAKQGRGLVRWLKWVNLFGSLVVYDEEQVPENELIDFLKKTGYWLSAEGLRRQAIGMAWEKQVERFFNLCDKNSEWQLRVLEHRQRWKGSSHREFDHVYVCQLGPKELALQVQIIFECKAGFIRGEDVDEFYRAVINEPEFRNWQSGGQKCNLVLVLVGGKSADAIAFKKASRMGVKIVLHTSVEDVMERLTCLKESFYKIVRQETSSR